ncbi:hypothetical protein ACFH04_08355 [Streptomyces noboritoensis]|uniref:Transposase IS204/IS1001/IS1096/IS1165 zinc-finger domain-containing protein n=1 Tax=Streptomyces noboritoensis TaxID=67337 RepID=A0ABV6TD72_9ACTN
MPSSAVCADVLGMVFPHLEKVLVEQVVLLGRELRVTARTRNEASSPCPDCGTVSRRVHSRRHSGPGGV